MSLKRRADIDSLFEQGQRFPTDFFTLIWQPANQFKYGVFVSKRLGCAPVRNRAKRRLREALRLSRSCLQAVGRVAVLPRPDRPEPKLEQLVEDVSRIFHKISNRA